MARAKALKPRTPRIPGLGPAPRYSTSSPEGQPRSGGLTLPGSVRKPSPRPPEGQPAVGGGRVPGTSAPAKPPSKPPSKGKGKGKGKAAKAPGYQTIAEREMQRIYGPVLGSYAQLIQSRQKQAADEAARKQAVYAAFAKYYQENAPKQIGGIYQQAASDQAAWAKGYSLGMQLAQQEQAASSNKTLDLINAPQEQRLTPGPEAANVIYGLGGAIPASTLSQQGAAFSAAAALQSPAIFSEGGRQANELLKTSAAEIEKLRFEALQVKTEMRQKVFELASSYRAAGQKAKADRLEALQKRADKATAAFGTWFEVRGNKIVNTHIPTLAGSKAKFGQDMQTKNYNLSVWKANHPNLQVIGTEQGGYYAFDPRTGTRSENPILAGTGKPIKVFGSGTSGVFAWDPNTGTLVQLRPPSKGKGAKAATQKTISAGWKMIKQAQKGFWASAGDPNSPLTSSELLSFQKQLKDGVDVGGTTIKMTWVELINLSQTNRRKAEAIEDALGIQYTTTDPADIYKLFQSLLESGIGKNRAIKMIDKYFPGWSKKITVEIPPGWVPKVNAAPSGGTAVQTSFNNVPAGITPSKYQNAAIAAANKYGVPVGIFLSMIQAESGWNPNAGSSAGAIGIAQFMPGTARGMGIDPRNPLQALAGAARMLKSGYRQFGSWELALAAYNAGSGAVQKYGGIPPYAETQGYVRRIMDMARTAGDGGNQGNFVSASTKQGGAWGGSLRLADKGKAIAEQFGLTATGKRNRKMTSSGGISDHWVGSKNAFAYDLSGTREQMFSAANALARSLGIRWDGVSELIEDVYVGPFRIQIIFNTPKYGGHMDHIHFGVRRVSGRGSYA